jgi:ficolin
LTVSLTIGVDCYCQSALINIIVDENCWLSLLEITIAMNQQFFMMVLHFTALALVLCPPVWADYFRSSYVHKVSGCSLGAVTQENVTPSEKTCRRECLAMEGCVAFSWQAESRVCSTQNLTRLEMSDVADDGVYFMLGDVRHPSPPVITARDCADILAADNTSESGVYLINVAGRFIVPVWCVMGKDGGAWTSFLRRQDGSVDFNQDWASYKAGFGSVCGEHWLGLDILHALTTSKTYKLLTTVTSWDNTSAYSKHEYMEVGNEQQGYELSLGGFLSGDGGNGLLVNNGRKFSTKDRDLDANSDSNCAELKHGGFWYYACSQCSPTSKYYTGGNYTVGPRVDGMHWESWAPYNNKYYSMKFITMMLRPYA